MLNFTAFIFATTLFGAAIAAEPAPEPSLTKQDLTPAEAALSSPAKSSAQVIRTIRKKKSTFNQPREYNRRMPPAGSAATGGTSASPGGAPTTPYGSPH